MMLEASITSIEPTRSEVELKKITNLSSGRYGIASPKIVTSNKQIEIKAPQNVDYPPANDLSAESVDVDKVINLDKRSRNKYETLDGVDSELESDEHPSQSDKGNEN